MTTNEKPADESGVLLLPDIARIFKTSARTVRRRLAAGTFPVPPIRGIDRKWRWSPVQVRRYLETGRRVR